MFRFAKQRCEKVLRAKILPEKHGTICRCPLQKNNFTIRANDKGERQGRTRKGSPFVRVRPFALTINH